MTRRFRITLGAITVVVALAIWEFVDRAGWISLETTARPSEIGRAALSVAGDGEVTGVVLHTVQALAVSWFAAILLGVAIGTGLGLWPRAQTLLGPTVAFFRFLPPPTLVPAVLLIWGFTMQSEIAVAVAAAVWPVVINTTAGVRQVDPRLLDVGRSLRLGPLRTVWRIVLPAAMPMILTGARVASSLCLILVITVEIIGVPEGIGYEIFRLSAAFRPDEAFVYVVLAGILGVLVNGGFRRIERAALRWQFEGAT